MELAIEKSLQYPWVNGGWKKMLVGGLISLAGGVISFAVTYAVLLLFLPIDTIMGNPEAAKGLITQKTMVIAKIAMLIVGFLISLAYKPLLFGYFWETIAQAKGHGEEYPTLPEWSGNWGYYYISGFKLCFYIYLIFAPIFLLYIFVQAGSTFIESNSYSAIISGLGGGILLLGLYVLYFFFMPFLLVPICTNSSQAILSDLFNVSNMIEKGKRHYGNLLLTLIFVFFIQLLFWISGFIFGLVTCCIGFLLLPIFSFGLMISNGLMLLHAYELDKPEETGQLSA